MPKAVLMCAPTFFDVREVKNPHMGASIDRVRAHQQWENVRQAMTESGLKVEIIDPVETLEDMVFAANQVFVGESPKLGKFVIPSHMRYPSRQKEIPFYIDWFRRHGYAVIELELKGEFLEGHGDLLWHPDHSRVWAGFGFRSSFGGVQQFVSKMQELEVPVTPLELNDAHFYHLDTCFCPLNCDAVLIYPAAFAPGALAAIRNGFSRVYDLSREEALHFVGNGVVANGRFLTPRLTDNLSRILSLEGLTAVVLDTSEFEKSGGSIFCMKCFLD